MKKTSRAQARAGENAGLVARSLAHHGEPLPYLRRRLGPIGRVCRRLAGGLGSWKRRAA